jgi:RNA methyltransferase, TrmH family
LDHHTDELIEIITSEPTHPPWGTVPVRVVSRKQFRSLSQAQSPQGTLAVVRLPTEIYSDGLPGRIGNRLLLLEDIQDPGNVGTLIRTAAAFDFSGIILTEKCADPFSPKCVQSTAGTVLSVWMRRTPHYGRLIRKLQEAGYFLITADVRAGSQPPPAKNRENLIVALANEAAGPSRWLIDASGLRFRIPINSLKAESLNVAACGAVCMYLFSRPAPSSPVPHTGGKSRPLRGPANVS